MPTPPPPCLWDLPDPSAAEAGQDVVAVGADLAPGTVWAGYRKGMFPMHLETGELAWWSPDPRGVLPLDGLRVTRSLRASARRYKVTFDAAFGDVIEGCASPNRDFGWITPEIVATYSQLHRLGWAHSVEVWAPDGTLAGGLYGVEIGGLFAGESMFHRQRDASKVALLALVGALRADGRPRLLDVQWRTAHLASMGVVEIPRTQYLAALKQALGLPTCLSSGHKTANGGDGGGQLGEEPLDGVARAAERQRHPDAGVDR
jgi:leucyl/phenylalanyl-tRNA--protein transferase